MTTYDEISTCRKRNRRFWNQECRYVIIHIRDAQQRGDNQREAHCRRWLSSELCHRREHQYLIGRPMKATTKACRLCGSDVLRLFRSLNLKQCHECGHRMPWNLEPGQAPLIGPSRDRYIVTGEHRDSSQFRKALVTAGS